MTKTVLIYDHGPSNKLKWERILKRNDVDFLFSSRLADVESATHLIIPGVGSFDALVKSLKHTGFWELLKNPEMNEQKSILGVCLGMHVFLEGSEEGNQSGLEVLSGTAKRIPTSSKQCCPNVGWGRIQKKSHSSTTNKTTDLYYFSHSYFLENGTSDYIDDVIESNQKMAAVIRHKNFVGCQFHPEISRDAGNTFFNQFLG